MENSQNSRRNCAISTEISQNSWLLAFLLYLIYLYYIFFLGPLTWPSCDLFIILRWAQNFMNITVRPH